MNKKRYTLKIKTNDSASTNRIIRENNQLYVKNSIITEECVSKYLGKEIDGYDDLGLDGETVYGVYRPAEELKKCTDTFNLVQLMLDHHDVDADNPKLKQTIGAVGNCRFEDGKLIADLCVYVEDIIELILDNEITGLSCGYTYEYEKENGTFNGEEYQIRMVNIIGNHVALVDRPRVKKARVNDSDKNKINNNVKKGITMFKTLMNKLSKINKIKTKDSENLTSDSLSNDIFDIMSQEGEKEDKIEMLKQYLDSVLDKLVGVQDEDKVDTVDEDKVDAEDEEVTVAEAEKMLAEDEDIDVQDEDKVDAEDEDIDAEDEETVDVVDEDTVEKTQAKDGFMSKKLKAYDRAYKEASKLVGKLNYDNFGYNASKVLDKALSLKKINTKDMDLVEKYNTVKTLNSKNSKIKAVSKKINATDKQTVHVECGFNEVFKSWKK